MAVLLLLLNLVDELPRTIRVLAPDIQRSLGISDTVLFGVLGFGGVALVLGTVPMAALADRIRRVALIPIMSGFWAVATFLSGLVVNPFQLFWATAATGLGQAYRIPVSNSLITDTYPIQARSRIFAFEGVGRPIGQLSGRCSSAASPCRSAVTTHGGTPSSSSPCRRCCSASLRCVCGSQNAVVLNRTQS